jgi:hypothetical protein
MFGGRKAINQLGKLKASIVLLRVLPKKKRINARREKTRKGRIQSTLKSKPI